MKNRIPVGLIFSRLIIGLVIVCLSLIHGGHVKVLIVVLLIAGLLTDILDGIIARRLQLSTQKLRRLDSTVDQIFFICVTIASYIQCSHFFTTNAYELIILIAFECLTYVTSFIKFKKEIATHSIGAKIWTLLLVVTLIQIILQCQSTVLFAICFWFGLLTRLEIIAIILTLKKWTNDVPTIFHAIQLRQGKEIKRHKLFNG